MCYKKLFCSLLLSLLAFCTISLKNTCKAYNTNITEFENDIRAKFNILKENGVIGQSFNVNNLGTAYSDWYDYVIFLRPNDLSNGSYSKIWTAVWNRNYHNSIVNNDYNQWGYGNKQVQVRGYNATTGNVTDSWWAASLNGWSFDYAYTTIAVNTTSLTLGEGEEYGQYYITEPPSTFNFHFYDESITASVPNGATAYCVFLDPISDNQKIGYIENFEEHKNTQIQIFAQNYRNTNNVLVNSIGEMNYYLNESGELFVNTNTMWSALVYEIVGIDNGPSGDFLNGQNFTAYYYIAARQQRKW